MINTDKPGGRRLLFIILVVIFAVVVFTVRYILIALGWIGGEEELKKPQEKTQIEKPLDPTPNQIEETEMNAAKKVVEKIIPLYLTKDYNNLDGWLSQMKPYLSDKLYNQWIADTQSVRPVMGVTKSRFEKLGPIHCISEQYEVSCAVEGEYENVDQQNKATSIFESFEVILGQSGIEWKVEDLTVHGDFE